MKFCMIDLETLAIQPSAYILSCGAVIRDTEIPLTEQKFNHFSVRLPVQQTGRYIDPETVFWHMLKTSQPTKDATFGGKRSLSLSGFLHDFREWYTMYQPDTVWSKGVDFDITIMEHVFKAEKIKAPWTYKDKRCYRTLLEVAMSYDSLKEKILSIPGNTEDSKSHTALEDAINQAKTLWHILRHLEDRVNLD